MTKQNCAICAFRAKYDNNPGSFTGRLWRWHINFCPGWKQFFISLSPEEKTKIADNYSFNKYR